MNSVMLDFETLGNGKHSCIVQIGAVYFDPDTGEIGKQFSINVDAESAINSGADLDASTVYWWLQQSQEAIKSIMAKPLCPIQEAMSDLNIFLQGAKHIWSHATFDFVILTETLKRLKIKPNFKYQAARDIRTLMYLAGDAPSIAREGVHHNALDDCKFQVKYCVAALRRLMT